MGFRNDLEAGEDSVKEGDLDIDMDDGHEDADSRDMDQEFPMVWEAKGLMDEADMRLEGDNHA
jgi:hypothetical protein